MKLGQLGPTVRILDMGVYKVWANEDVIEGRGRSLLIGCFMDKVRAENFAKGRGVSGTDARITTAVERIVYVVKEDGSYQYFLLGEEITRERTQKEIKAEALAKLTAEERLALGL